MFRLTAVAVCVLLTLSATGQQKKYNVVLNDGSRISGTIIADSAGYMDIRVTTPQVIRIGKSQVSSLETLAYPVKKNLKTEGYYIRYSTGILSGKNESGSQSSLSFHLANGYQFKNGIGIGIGSGMEELGVVIVPVYADLNYTPLNSRISPYAWLKTGYGFATSDQAVTYEFYPSADSKTKGGFLFNAGAGICLYTWPRTAINIGIGYRYQIVTISRDQYWWRTGISVRESVTHFNRLELQMGFIFR
jgi:hypothetical protein